MMALVPTIFHIRNVNDSINPTQIISKTSNKRVCVCKCDVISKNYLPIFEYSSKQNNDTSVVTISARVTKSRRRLKVLWQHVRFSSGNLDFESQDFIKLCQVWECSTNEKQLRSLGSYFGRLQGGGNKKNLDYSFKKIKVLDTGQFKAKKELQLLDAYFEKVDKATDLHNHTAVSSFDEQHEGKLDFTSSPFEDHDKDDDKTHIQHEKLNGMVHRSSMPKTTQLQEQEVCDLYLISTLVSVNIAVFLFEIASPVKNSELQLFSLPSVYGAKINELILVGEWWRLVTPMFLVQD